MHRLSDEKGITLVELLVSMSILSIVLLVFTSTLASVQRAQVDQDVRSRLNDEARLALQSIDRLVRSGNILYRPEDEAGNDPIDVAAIGYLFRLYTQAKFQPTDDPRCYVWLIDDQQRLLQRWWPTLDPDDATSWHVVAGGIVNREIGVPAFDLADDATSRTVVVTFHVNPDIENRPEATQEIQTAVTGRNTSFGYPVAACSTLPSDMSV
jgi:prepilin-type N-terminal cleavage/methylation domain-containing protein